MFWIAQPRDVFRVHGADAVSYLHSQLSQAVGALAVGESTWSFVLQPTGKVEVLLRVWRVGDQELVLDTDAGFGDALLARLNRFKIRVEVDIEPLDWQCIALRGDTVDRSVLDHSVVAWGAGADLLGPDVAAPADVPAGSATDYDDARIAAGWPAMGAEILPGETIPAETGVVAEAVSFTKGCYPGQELVERMDSRGSSAPFHLVVLHRSTGDAVGGEVLVDGASVGTITSVGTRQVLARVRRSVETVRREADGMARSEAQLATQMAKIRTLCTALPEVTEEVTWGTDVNFRVRKKIFCFPGTGGSLTVKADREELPALLADKRVTPAPYLARGGWIRLDLTTGRIDWGEIDELIRTSYTLIAPKKLSAQLG